MITSSFPFLASYFCLFAFLYSQWCLFIERSKSQTKTDSDQPCGACMLLKENHIHYHCDELIHHSNQSISRCTHKTSTKPTSVSMGIDVWDKEKVNRREVKMISPDQSSENTGSNYNQPSCNRCFYHCINLIGHISFHDFNEKQ